MTTDPTPRIPPPSAESGSASIRPLSTDEVRWRCDPARLGFDSTAELEPPRTVVGQEAAIEALRFGLAHYAPGQNIFVRGLTGTGRMTMVRQLLENIVPACPIAPDRCYVHNFDQPDRPRLITMPRGTARRFQRRVEDLRTFIRDDLGRALASETLRDRHAALQQAAKERSQAFIEPFEKELKEAGLAFVVMHAGPISQGALFPIINDKPTPPEEFERMHAAGEVSDELYEHVREQHERFGAQLEDVTRRLIEERLQQQDAVRNSVKKEARSILEEYVARLADEFPSDAIRDFLEAVVEDLVEERLGSLEEAEEFTQLYRVNVILDHEQGAPCPIIAESSPSMMNLLGSIDIDIGPTGMPRTDHMMIHGGSLLRADGGYLILEARDVLTEPQAWRFLVRVLRNSRLEIVPPELAMPWGRHSLKPEPIDLNIKVILLGDAETYYLLDQLDTDFPQLFKVLADFDSTMPRNDEGIRHYASVVARIAAEGDLPPFDRTAVAALVEHGARIASRSGKLSARFSRLADIAREAAFLARSDARELVTGDDVCETVRRTKRRANLASRHFRELLADGTIRVQTSGAVVGQINGLAVIAAGQLTYGFPARVTATIGAGTAGVVNIEREANLSGAIHTKGFYILGGLLRFLLQTDHPLAFDASIAFEQSYGGIDGDSASGAEICCLLSALTDVPLRQDLAMTGAIDQLGHILAIGAVNEKIEGFYDTCRDIGLTGTQGVIIPRTNAGELMLRDDCVEACRDGSFHVYAVGDVCEALELLTGMPPGRRDGHGEYPADSILGRAVTRAGEYWKRASERDAKTAS